MFRTRLRIPRRIPALRPAVPARRSLHQLPTLQHDFSEGIPDLMSPAGFSLAWNDYMSLMVEKLNALTAGTDLEDRDMKTIILHTAREPSQAPLFNYASMAHNTHFFFQGISPTGSELPKDLAAELSASFSSVETLRREFVLTAQAMFGPGFLWLVKAGPCDYRLLTTYLAGSPYSGAHWRAQQTDMNTVGSEGSARGYFRNQVMGGKKRSGDLPPGGIDVEPLLCLNTWEHSWLFDWGVGVGGQGGKMAYAEAWWNRIDWEKVANRAGVLRPNFMTAASE
ncbi:hypothetical protein HIM_07010 [Hirsutella minnesotensis 3608]|uniref:Manganese/iron superoxide dismutase C-terminal domain-containing protein n=1 Tax=Hirsutella minnesotensis 3608 TaxID=1043627 RepID=A0A0F7ZZ64_9HYPO|nr:hypothetical protein HIM_07010 [Hirsutella minnesotensis 3608]